MNLPTLLRLQDNLAMSAIRFLTTVSKSVHHRLFADQGALKQVRGLWLHSICTSSGCSTVHWTCRLSCYPGSLFFVSAYGAYSSSNMCEQMCVCVLCVSLCAVTLLPQWAGAPQCFIAGQRLVLK